LEEQEAARAARVSTAVVRGVTGVYHWVSHYNLSGVMSMASPTDRRYKDSHEWHKPVGGEVVVGISKFAVDELTDITYLDIKVKPGSSVKADATFAEIESVKATSEIYSGIDGKVTAVNQAVIDNPALLNEDPWEKGWLIKVQPSNPKQLDALLSGADYDKQHGV
jgi:glycine cleavage system H protein